MGYRRNGVPADPVVTQELDRIALAFAQPGDYLALKTLYAEPARYFEGMIVKADGTSWDPGSGGGMYEYRSGWQYLEATGGGGGGGSFDGGTP